MKWNVKAIVRMKNIMVSVNINLYCKKYNHLWSYFFKINYKVDCTDYNQKILSSAIIPNGLIKAVIDR